MAGPSASSETLRPEFSYALAILVTAISQQGPWIRPPQLKAMGHCPPRTSWPCLKYPFTQPTFLQRSEGGRGTSLGRRRRILATACACEWLSTCCGSREGRARGYQCPTTRLGSWQRSEPTDRFTSFGWRGARSKTSPPLLETASTLPFPHLKHRLIHNEAHGRPPLACLRSLSSATTLLLKCARQQRLVHATRSR